MLLNCKFCGGELDVAEGVSITTCKYCRTAQTLPITKNDGVQNLFNRASALRRRCDFDKAEALYEKILETEANEAEAYWGLVLCRYGIEYVEDPQSGKMMPTCHRASYDPVVADGDYRSAIEYAEEDSRILYEEQARAIDRIQREILALAQKEEGYDVFICYKETDENGQRTRDSVIANDIYYQLKDEGLKVFYSAITLEGKLGQDYEPIIFAALNSARVMLVIGTKPEYFNAVWVKNEWSRYLKIIRNDRKKLLIPCYRYMDAYDLPDEFAHLQAQNMEKIGFVNDLIRGINKVMEGFKKKPDETDKSTETVAVEKETAVNAPATVRETVIREPSGGMSVGGASTVPLLKRAFIFLEDGDFESADEYCERVLDADPENAEAYLGKLMVELKVRRRERLKDCEKSFDTSDNCKKALRFAYPALKNELNGYIEHIAERNESERLEKIYNNAKSIMSEATDEAAYNSAASAFAEIKDYKDSAFLYSECLRAAKKTEEQNERLACEYASAKAAISDAKTAVDFKELAERFESLGEYGNSKDFAEALNKSFKKKAIREAKERQYAEKKGKHKKITVILCYILLLAAVSANLYFVAMSMKEASFAKWHSLWPAWISSSVMFILTSVLAKQGYIYFGGAKTSIDSACDLIILELLAMLLTEVIFSYIFCFDRIWILRILGGIARGIVCYIVPTVVAFFAIGIADHEVSEPEETEKNGG